MNTNHYRTTRPSQVSLAAALLVLYVVFGFTGAVDHRPPENTTAFCVAFAFLALMLLWIWLINRGANWARWLFLAWFIWNLLLAPWHIRWSLAELHPFFCVQTLLQLGALALLFLPSGNYWFRCRPEAA